MMSKQHHFVVYYDETTGLFEMDYDSQDVKFQGKPIFNLMADANGHDGWEPIGDELNYDNSTYNRAADALVEALRDLQLREVWNG